MPDIEAEQVAAPTLHAVEFHGRGRDYFRIWIVNATLTVLTLGLYSAWAKVRTRRYFYGNTYVAGHAFGYHGSPWRILFGRVIALALIAATVGSFLLTAASLVVWLPVLAAALPWLVKTSLRFHARNTSWRHVRFNFSATYWEAFMAYVLWPVLALVFFPLLPFTRRVRDYFRINHHRIGGCAIRTAFSTARIYALFLFGFIVIVGILVVVLGLAAGIMVAETRLHDITRHLQIPGVTLDYGAIVYLLFGFGALYVASAVNTMAANLALNSTTIENGIRLVSRAAPLRVAWILFSSAFLTLVTLGLYYPFARVRLTRYRMSKCALIGDGDLDDFTCQSLDDQSVIGREISGFFDSGFGL